jgi:hypothetical protein
MRRMSSPHVSKTHETGDSGRTIANGRGQQKADGPQPTRPCSEWVTTGIWRHWVQNGYKWVKMDISHAPHHQHHDHP